MPKYDMEEKLAEFHTQGYVVFEGYAPTLLHPAARDRLSSDRLSQLLSD